MLNNKGSSLVESLFAFMIYTTVLVLFISLITVLNHSVTKINRHHLKGQQKELEIIENGRDEELKIKEVLR
ncbi:hypothetical protein HMPREF9943_00769 [Eggerthia catenaformis OT 569 = DSM 20559]|uniref:Uncharacterized protein n=1 Tax=Eggerthia catenaformis OT 569 = DSM 20559 TaxID=999415 RepID=M2Q430_9FIRM|nr:hypothetical protein [Eggerthia catenaformis]EMD16991.1 hypothetical protein HMPREF9943_00769 [Eggerthia catenaformis OT 569 = DSM 20559]OUC51899.1 hypothetical protein B7939_03780 [Eggerthia catenaformis]